MKRALAVLFFVSTLQATTLTGTFETPDQRGATGTLTLALAQQAALVSTGGCGGPLQLVPNYQVMITVTSGTMSGTPTVYGNDCMLPQGVYYKAQFTDNNGNVLFTDNWLITGSTIDVGTIVSTTVSGTIYTLGAPGVVFTLPTTSQTVNQPLSTTLNVNTFNVTNSLTLPNGSVCTTTGCTGSGLIGPDFVTTDTNQTIIGQKTFTSDILSSGAAVGTLTNPFTNGIFSGAVEGGTISAILGAPSSPVDSYTFTVPTAHQFNLLQASGPLNQILLYDATGSAPVWSFQGTVQTSDTSVSALGTTANPWWGLQVKGPVLFAYDGNPADIFEVDEQTLYTSLVVVSGSLSTVNPILNAGHTGTTATITIGGCALGVSGGIIYAHAGC